MKIQYDYSTFTFSDITLEEFRSIRKFMALGQSVVTAIEAKGKEEINTIGSSILNQLENLTIPGI